MATECCGVEVVVDKMENLQKVTKAFVWAVTGSKSRESEARADYVSDLNSDKSVPQAFIT